MSDASSPSSPSAEPVTQGMSSWYKLLEAFVALREKNERQHRLFEQSLLRTRQELQESFNAFAAATQSAYQQLRRELQGEKRATLALLNDLLDIGLELEHLVAVQPNIVIQGPESESVARWAEAVAVECRRVQDLLRRHGIHRYDAVPGAPYDPALHERVGSRRLEGMEPYRVVEQKEHGYASQQPDFVLRRAKVIISE
jgi:molecular chaperone GrpE (heat shock protein)